MKTIQSILHNSLAFKLDMHWNLITFIEGQNDPIDPRVIPHAHVTLI
jgi:hypothetical protein